MNTPQPSDIAYITARNSLIPRAELIAFRQTVHIANRDVRAIARTKAFAVAMERLWREDGKNLLALLPPLRKRDMDPLLSSSELATLLRRNVSYVYQMRRRGFAMIGGRTTITAALVWLSKHPPPWSNRRIPTKSARNR